MQDKNMNEIDSLEIEPLSDEALDLVAGGDSSGGPRCCSCENCSNPPGPDPIQPIQLA